MVRRRAEDVRELSTVVVRGYNIEGPQETRMYETHQDNSRLECELRNVGAVMNLIKGERRTGMACGLLRLR